MFIINNRDFRKMQERKNAMRSLDTNVKRIVTKYLKRLPVWVLNRNRRPWWLILRPFLTILYRRGQHTGKVFTGERAVASERVRLAMGMSLRPENAAVHITAGL